VHRFVFVFPVTKRDLEHRMQIVLGVIAAEISVFLQAQSQ
jgi:hypothetical protein